MSSNGNATAQILISHCKGATHETKGEFPVKSGSTKSLYRYRFASLAGREWRAGANLV